MTKKKANLEMTLQMEQSQSFNTHCTHNSLRSSFCKKEEKRKKKKVKSSQQKVETAVPRNY